MSKIGIVGLGVMGSNLARNIASKQVPVSVYNRTTEKMTTLVKEHGNEYLQGFEELKDFVESIEKPRAILILVKAGDAVDKVIESLKPYLDPQDIVIEGGNSNYKDTQRRFKELAKDEINFFGMGISGGEEGALHGPSLMPGGHEPSYERLKPILEAIAAKDFNGQPCVTYCGQGPAGHYVKMVHNGIEYGMMQIMAEGYQILRDHFGLQAPQIAAIFKQYNQGLLKSFLFEISVEILNKEDEFQEGYLIDYILDKAAQKGTGKWTAVESLDRGIPCPTIYEAVNARTMSSFKEKREQLDKIYPDFPLHDNWDPEEFAATLEKAMYAAIITSYAQGYHLIEAASQEEDWNTNLSEISRIWQGGCIIRAEVLETLHKSFKQAAPGTHLFEMPSIQKALEEYQYDLRDVVILGHEAGIPTPSMAASLSYIDTMTKARGSANFIQGLRDNFGAHTYQRTDKEGPFHTDWLAIK